MRRFASLGGLMLLLGSMLASVGCSKASLHPSFGQLYRDVNIAQLSAHPAHEPTVRGQEVNLIIQRLDTKFVPQQGGGGASPMGTATAGVMPMH